MTLVWIIAAYILIDALSGVYHFITDKGWNIKSQCEMFAEHHNTNTMQEFDWQTWAVALPIVGVGAWFHSPFWIACGIFTALTQVTHYFAQRRSGNRVCDAVVRFAQRAGLIVRPASHARHHKPPHNRDFCLLSGWNNLWMNQIVRLT